MIRKFKLAVILCSACVTTNAGAVGIANNFGVAEVRVDSSGKGYITFDTSLVARSGTVIPECTQDKYSNMLAFDTNTGGGKAIMSLALTAKTTGKKIIASGSGNCNLYGVMEDWSYGRIN